MLDRSELSRCLAKAIAYKQCNKPADCELWIRKLLSMLGMSHLLKEG